MSEHDAAYYERQFSDRAARKSHDQLGDVPEVRPDPGGRRQLPPLRQRDWDDPLYFVVVLIAVIVLYLLTGPWPPVERIRDYH